MAWLPWRRQAGRSRHCCSSASVPPEIISVFIPIIQLIPFSAHFSGRMQSRDLLTPFDGDYSVEELPFLYFDLS
ncbi:uncharacterized [Tachysurus ichikawai]